MRKDITVSKLMNGGDNVNKTALAEQYGCCWRTIDRRLNPHKYQKEKKIRTYSSKLDPYKNIIDEKIENNNIPATGIYFLLKNKYDYDGKYGNYPERKTKLEAEGYNYSEVQNRVNELLREDIYLSNPNYSGISIIDALKQINIDSSYLYRSRLSSANEISNYIGSAEQNLLLLDKLKKGQLKKV